MPKKFEITRARAFSKDILYACGMPKKADAQDPFTRIYQFFEGSWSYVDVDISTQRIVCYHRPDGGRIAVYMSHHGMLFSPEPSFQGGSILDGKLDATKRLGRLSDLRQIGQTLVACGEGAQTYRQIGDGTWLPLDLSAFEDKIDSRWVFAIKPEGSTGAEEEAYWAAHPDRKAELDRRLKLYTTHVNFNSINGPGLDKLYMSSSKGEIYYWNGQNIRKMASPASAYLTDILVQDVDTIWICGREGTLLSGNATTGFKAVPCEGTPNFSKMTIFKGKIYLSSYADPRGAFCYDGRRIQQVDSGMPGGLNDVHTVDAVGDALWTIGSNELSRFDGSSWERVPFPK